MMTCDKRNEIFLIQNQPNITKKVNKKIPTSAVISHNSSSKRNQFNKTKTLANTRMMTVDLSSKKFQRQPPQQQHIESYLRECKQQSQTIISKIFKQEESAMSEKAARQTHMTFTDYLEFSNKTTTTVIATTLTTSKRINENICVEQNNQNINHSGSKNTLGMINSGGKQQHQHKIRPTFDNTTDPQNILPNLATISTKSSLLSTSASPSTLSLCAFSLTSPPTKTIATTAAETVRRTEFNVAALAKVLTIPVTGDAGENLQVRKQQCNNVCISSKCCSKLNFSQQKKQKRQCKSANISNCTNELENIRTFNNTNTTTHHTEDGSSDTATPAVAPTTTTTTTTQSTAARAVGSIKNSNNITTTSTTNKANIRSNTVSTTTSTTSAPHSNHAAYTAAFAKRPTKPAEPTTPATTTTTYCKAFPLRQRTYQNLKQLECLMRAVAFSFIFVMSMQFQNVSASTSMMNKHEPMFISRSETFKFVAGDTIVLPCEVANTDPYVVAWKRGIAILTAGSVKVTPDPRVRLVNGFNLQIRDAVPQDAGDYICQIATMEPREITHTVEILVPPRIHHISTSGHLQVKKGSSVTIECSASGNPKPNVTWSRKNNILPNGEEKLHSHILSIENVDRHKGGVYICTANNGVGQPASSQVVLHVLYPPEITVERPVVFSGEGHEAMLVCIVHGETQPEVIWFKDTMQLDTTERHIMENRGSRHTLIIRKVHPQDFGNYSCVAENQLGKSRKTLQLSGKPNIAIFNSPPISQYKDRYNISWTVESHTPIEEYKLSFRKLQQGQEVDNSIDSHSSSSSSMLQLYGGSSVGNLGAGIVMGVNAHNYRLNSMNSMVGSSGYGSYGAGNVIHWGRNDWRDVVLPAIPTSHHYTQGMSYMIRGLDPDQHYEATVQARNRYGWSDFSQSFVFSTSSNDNEMRDLSVTFYGSKSPQLHGTSFLTTFAAITVSLRVIMFSY